MLSRIGRYEISAELGRGSVGVVYKAHDPLFNREVAIKHIVGHGADRALVDCFVRETQAVARLENPAIVKIFDIGEENDGLYLVMELVQGIPLSRIVNAGVRPSPKGVEKRLLLFERLLEAVKYAHDNGVVHKDIKPGNVLITQAGFPKLMDFGIASIAGLRSVPLAELAVKNSAACAFMSPEILSGSSIGDQRSDIYSLGLLLSTLITGRMPSQIASGDWPSPELEVLVGHMVAVNPDERYQNITELMTDCNRIKLRSFAPSPSAVTGDSLELPGSGPASLKLNKTANLSPWTKCRVGDYIKFGHYPQGTRGEEKPIEWRVLAKDAAGMIIMSRYGLDRQPYHPEGGAVTWENSGLRRWLNSDFLDNAFSDEERAQVAATHIANCDNHKYGTRGGNDTDDRIFLFSFQEVEQLFPSDIARSCVPTAYAKGRGVKAGPTGCCWWWLRSPGMSSDFAGFISHNGEVMLTGDMVDSDDLVCVRPVCRIAFM